jgi:aminomuconate-semialdehyde/2-hydroxymuconate-6-semialdehyde dehydrogenase
MDELTHLIDGERVATDQWFDTINPATQQPWAKVARGSAQDAARAVNAARVAFDDGPWPRMTPDERGAHLHRLADLIEQHTDELVALETTDMGKPVTQCRERDLPRSVANFRFFADYPRFCEDESLPSSSHHIYTSYEPVGVTAAISPWNFPLMLSTWKVAPALAFGNTVVLKPAEQSPGTCTRLGELAIEAGLPKGVLNILHGYGPGEVGEALTTSPDVDLVTFTGESNTGRKILQAGAPTLKRVSFELGGKSANLVFADADLDAALDWSIKAAFTNSGQVCLAGSRLYVERAIFDEFVDRFVDLAERLVVGDPTDPVTDIGPLASEEHWQKVCHYFEIAEADGAKLLTGGPHEGWWVRPTVLVNTTQEMRISREEIFGPIVTIAPFDGEADAIRLANDSRYGLNAMVFTENARRAHRVARAVRAGTVWVNCYFVRDLRAPFGGFKDSGIGREGGKHSREFFTEAKTVVMEI